MSRRSRYDHRGGSDSRSYRRAGGRWSGRASSGHRREKRAQGISRGGCIWILLLAMAGMAFIALQQSGCLDMQKLSKRTEDEDVGSDAFGPVSADSALSPASPARPSPAAPGPSHNAAP